MKYISLCSGIGGFELAIHRVFPHAVCLGYSEIDPRCLKIYQRHFPTHPPLGDVSKVEWQKIEKKVDLVVAGFPCQDLSSIRFDGAGLAGEKSGLFFEILRCLRETKPKYFLIENVASMKHADRDRISAALGVEPVEINAAEFTGQHRRRLFWANFPILKRPASTSLVTLSSQLDGGKKAKRDQFASLACSEACIRYIFSILPNGKPRFATYRIYHDSDEKVSRSITADIKGHVIFDKRFHPTLIRYLSLHEVQRLQGFPLDWTLGVSDTAQRKALGNAVCVPVVEFILKQLY